VFNLPVAFVEHYAVFYRFLIDFRFFVKVSLKSIRYNLKSCIMPLAGNLNIFVIVIDSYITLFFFSKNRFLVFFFIP
jgi:hypothetical protein